VLVRVAVFTGSSPGPDDHAAGVAEFARHLARSGVGIVYGGAKVGLMGVVADAALSAGGEVIGVVPRFFECPEIAHAGLTRLETVPDLHARKARRAELADAFIALPGGAGTLDELFEAVTWGQLGLHAKPVALLNLGGFYDLLIGQMHLMRDAGYLDAAYLGTLGVVSDADEFLGFVAG
jgi:uncharacterized protein (TIGR00730 family)